MQGRGRGRGRGGALSGRARPLPAALVRVLADRGLRLRLSDKPRRTTRRRRPSCLRLVQTELGRP